MVTPKGRFSALDASSERLGVIAVDLGYSSRRKSCGIARSETRDAKCFRFGEAIAFVADSLRDNAEQVLVLEAVLSTSHCEKGNPRDRGQFERGRSWYYGPGAVTFLAAARFLSELHRALPAGQQVLLAEAFLSNKAERSRHDGDASLIATTFWKRPTELLIEGVEPITPLVMGVPPVKTFAYVR